MKLLEIKLQYVGVKSKNYFIYFLIFALLTFDLAKGGVSVFTYPYLSTRVPAQGEAKGLIKINYI